MAFLVALPAIAAQYETAIPGATIAAITSDRFGAVYVTGSTSSTNLPVTPNALQTYIRGVCGQSASGPIPCTDAFVAKINPNGTFAYLTYLGGAGNDAGTSIAVDVDGGVWVAGTTASADFPNTGDVVQSTNHGPFGNVPSGDVFIVKIARDGDRIVYATFLGGPDGDVPRRIAIDPQGNICVAGTTAGSNFPITGGAYNGSRGPSFVAKLSATLRELLFSTLIEGEVSDMAAAPGGSIFITGWSKTLGATVNAFQTTTGAAGGAFVARLKSDGTDMLFATYLGDGANGRGVAVVTDALATPWVVLQGRPTASDAPGFYLVRVDPYNGTKLLSSDRIGGETGSTSPTDWSLNVDFQNRVWVAGSVSPERFSTTAGAMQTGTCSADVAYFYRRYAASGALEYSTFMNQRSTSISVDGENSVYFVRQSRVSKPLMSPNGAPAQAFCAVNSASFRPAGLSPGEAFTLFGAGMGPQDGSGLRYDTMGRVATDNRGVAVRVNGVLCPLLYVQAQQINAVAPHAIAPGEKASIVVEYNGIRTEPLEFTVAPHNPGIFIADARPYGQGAIHNSDGRVNARNNPAPLGTSVAMWATGLGVTDPASKDGEWTVMPPGLKEKVRVFVAGVPAFLDYAGAAPSLVAGISQINFRLPDSLPAGTNFEAVPISLQMGDGAPSITLATLAVR